MPLARRHCLAGREACSWCFTLLPCPPCSLLPVHCFPASELCCHPLATLDRASGLSLTTATAMATTTTVRLDWTKPAMPHLQISADRSADCGPSVCLAAAGDSYGNGGKPDYNNGGKPDYNNGEPGWRAGGQLLLSKLLAACYSCGCPTACRQACIAAAPSACGAPTPHALCPLLTSPAAASACFCRLGAEP